MPVPVRTVPGRRNRRLIDTDIAPHPARRGCRNRSRYLWCINRSGVSFVTCIYVDGVCCAGSFLKLSFYRMKLVRNKSNDSRFISGKQTLVVRYLLIIQHVEHIKRNPLPWLPFSNPFGKFRTNRYRMFYATFIHQFRMKTALVNACVYDQGNNERKKTLSQLSTLYNAV